MGKFLFYAFVVSITVFAGCRTVSGETTENRSISDRIGFSFELSIDGSKTVRVKETKIEDANGSVIGTVNWKAKTTGNLCLTISPGLEWLGTYKKSSIAITQIHYEKPHTRWKNFKVIPSKEASTTYGGVVITPQVEFCPKEFILTDRLRYPKLPEGVYVLSIRVFGEKNWDKREILLEVSKG